MQGRWVSILFLIQVLLAPAIPGIAQEATPPLPPLAHQPIPLGNGFELLYVYASEVTDDLMTGPVLLGEIRNTSETPAVAPVVRFDLLDASEMSLGYVDAMPLALYAPGEARVPLYADPVSFENTAPGVSPGQWSREAISVCDTGLALSDVDPTGLEIRNVRYEIDAVSDPGTFAIDGSVTNVSQAAMPYVDVVAPFYAPDGRFVGFDSQAIVMGIAAGAEVPFSLGSLRHSNQPGLDPDEKVTPVTWDLFLRRQQRFQPATCGAPIM